MTETINQNPTCKAVCWLIGIAAGGYLAVVLVNDFGQAQIQSAVLGIVTMLLTGLLLRRILCRGRGSRVQQRVAEAHARAAAAEAQAAAKPARTAAKPVAKVAATPLNYDEEMVAKPAVLTPRPVEKIAPKTAPESIAKPAPAPKTTPQTVQKVAEKIADKPAMVPATIPTTKPASPLRIVEKAELVAPKPATSLPPLKTTAADTVVPGVDVTKLSTPQKPAATKPAVVAVTPSQPGPKKPETAPVPSAAAVRLAKAPQVIKPSAPKGLGAPENGTPDDLQKIEGIGETEEKALNAAGIFHFAQFVTMNRRELAWLDQNIATNQDVEPSYEWRKQAIALTRKAG
ncbi:MAG: hypothetical protein GXP05_13710 [Alphaproteobacteria bacterium]|nr:hypothetical protein [Alphaproteobacteria bacterium]